MKDKIKKFIVDNFTYGKGIINDNDQLFDSGIIDSLGLIRLLTFIEKSFNVSIGMSEIDIENFSTVNKIVFTIGKKLKK